MYRDLLSRNLLCTSAFIVAAGITAGALAQPPRNPPPNRPAAQSAASGTKTASKFLAIPGLFPLSMSSVQRDIGLSAEQKQQLKAISDGYLATMDRMGKAYDQLGQEDKQQQAKDFNEQAGQAARSAQSRAEAALSPQQLQIVKAVAFQLSATGVLADAGVQQKIGLSDEQRERLTKVFEQAGEKMQQLQRETAQQAMQVLEPEQMGALKRQIDGQQKQ